MELVFVYIEEHKILNKIPFITHPLFNVELDEKKIKISIKDEKIINYYNGVTIKAIIGKNGCGKSTFLEFIEESFNYTESSGFMIWFRRSDNTLIIQNVNYAIDMLDFDFCYPHSIMRLNRETLKRYSHKIVKINNISTLFPSVKTKKTCNIIDLSLSKQNKLTGNTKNTNLRNLITFFNESTWIDNKKAAYRYVFNFKSPSSVIKNWVFDIYRKDKPDINEHALKKDFSNSLDFIFHPFDPSDWNIRSRNDIFYMLIHRNIFSFIRYISSTHIVDDEFTDMLAINTIKHFRAEKYIFPYQFIDLIDRVYIDWKEQNKNKFNTTEIDSDILKYNINNIFMILKEISSVFYDYLFITDMRIVTDSYVVYDFEVIIRLLELISKLPKHINNNFSYGWVGFSSGELAKLNIFSSMYNHIKKNNRGTTLFILDETDLYLHPEWQRTFISELISFLEKETDISKIQILITTHSPLIIGDFLPDDIISLQLDANGIPCLSEAYGFGTEITDAYISGMHISSTFGEHSRNKILRLINNKSANCLSEDDHWLISRLKDSSIKRMLAK
ncbi:TPA: AAA family ATPase [Yersinia enterocolitica]